MMEIKIMIHNTIIIVQDSNNNTIRVLIMAIGQKYNNVRIKNYLILNLIYEYQTQKYIDKL
jgi:hypothetical protein